MANGADIIAGGEFLDDFDVRGQTCAGEHALEQIMTEKGRVRGAAGEGSLERIDVVDAFSRIGSFPEKILIDVGDRGGVGIDSAHARED